MFSLKLRKMSTNAELDALLTRINRGDLDAREQLVEASCERLQRLTRRLLDDFPGVRRWESTDDVFQRFVLNLYRSLSEVRPQNGRAFLGLAAVQIRRKLIDLSRHYRLENQAYKSSERVSDSELGDAGSVESVAQLTAGPATLQRWTEFHQLVDELPPEEREIMGLLYYQGLSQSEAAEILQVSERTVKRRWREARLKLHQLLGDSLLD
jgi:RNA polymerase sigma factor (sigma-70 family)